MTEALHEHILSKGRGFKVRAVEFLDRYCSASGDRGDEERIAQACDGLKFYGGVIGRRHFNGAPPNDANLFERTTRICVDELGMCYAPEDPPVVLAGGAAVRRDAARCAAAPTLAADMHDVFNRRDLTHPAFDAEREARAVVVGACTRLSRRYPGGAALRALEQACEVLVDEHEEELVSLLAQSAANGGGDGDEDDGDAWGAPAVCKVAGWVCPNVDDVPVWDSPWATRGTSPAAREALEAGKTGPTDLVRRLLAMSEEQILDARRDPDGRNAAAASPQLAKKTKAKKKKARKSKAEL